MQVQPEDGQNPERDEGQGDPEDDRERGKAPSAIIIIIMNYNQDLISIQQEAFKFIYKKDHTKNELQALSQLLRKWPSEVQTFRQYCLNAKLFSLGDVPKYIFIVTKGEFQTVRYVKQPHSRNPLAYISKIFNQEQPLQKQLKTVKPLETIGLDEYQNERYTYEVICSSVIGEVFCIKKSLFEKILDKKSYRKPNLQIDTEQNQDKPQIFEIQSAKGATPMSRLAISNVPRQPEEISTHRYEKRTIDFNTFRAGPVHKPQQPIKMIKEEEIEEPPLNNRFMAE